MVALKIKWSSDIWEEFGSLYKLTEAPSQMPDGHARILVWCTNEYPKIISLPFLQCVAGYELLVS